MLKLVFTLQSILNRENKGGAGGRYYTHRKKNPRGRAAFAWLIYNLARWLSEGATHCSFQKPIGNLEGHFGLSQCWVRLEGRGRVTSILWMEAWGARSTEMREKL